ncbi:MAG: ATP-binding cassette domain-containing protein, partial [Alphaproteobacteria bacterium]|nr:ATP-binding cassette domain-containing protein [Alphaproteobacteria bacterium]
MARETQAGQPATAAPLPQVPAIELRGISKAFGAVQANRDIDLIVMPGTVHGIVGENGAGKSTLMSILYGFYRADRGEILIGGARAEIADSRAAIRAGIGMVFQHFKLVPNFTVLENVILGAEEGARLAPSLARARAELARLARDHELEVDPDAVVETLSVGHQQRVEILKALYRQAEILILDEPTGVLTPAEADHLFRILRGLARQGKTVILITHKLREIMEVTDRVSVMRRGEMVATLETAATSPPELAELMVGRKVLLRVEKAPARPGPVRLRAEGLRLRDAGGVERLRGVG